MKTTFNGKEVETDELSTQELATFLKLPVLKYQVEIPFGFDAWPSPLIPLTIGGHFDAQAFIWSAIKEFAEPMVEHLTINAKGSWGYHDYLFRVTGVRKGTILFWFDNENDVVLFKLFFQ